MPKKNAPQEAKNQKEELIETNYLASFTPTPPSSIFPRTTVGLLRINSTISPNPSLFRGESVYLPVSQEGFKAPGYLSVFEKGFKARGTNTNLFLYAFPPHALSFADSAFIATSLSPKIAMHFPQSADTKSFVYQIETKKPIINVAKELAAVSCPEHLLDKCRGLQERAIFEKIEPHEIKGGWEVHNHKSITSFGHLIAETEVRQLSETFIPNPNYISPYGPAEKLLLAGKSLGYLSTAAGLYLDGSNLYNEFQQSKASGCYENTEKELVRVGTSWSAAFAIGSMMSESAAAACAPFFFPYGSLVCGFAGGLVGASFGAIKGGEFGKEFYYDIKRSNGMIIAQSPLSTFFSFFSPISSAKAAELPSFQNNTKMQAQRFNPKEQLIKKAATQPTTLVKKTATPGYIQSKASPRAHAKEQRSNLDLDSSVIYKDIHSRLQSIQESQSSDSKKVNLMLGEIRIANQTIKEQNQLAERQRDHEKVLANYQGAIDAGKFIHQIGQVTGNKVVTNLGITATALAQGALGCAQLFGIGMPAVTGLAMATPIAAIGGAVLCLGSLALGLGKSGKSKELKAFQSLTQQLSEQVMQVYYALDQKMTQGFAITFKNFEILNQNLSQGFNSVHEKLDYHFSNQRKLAIAHHQDLAKRMELVLITLLENQEIIFHGLNRSLINLDFKFDALGLQFEKMDQKLDRVLNQLLQTSLRSDDQSRQKMYELVEDYNHEPTQKHLFKLMKAIRGQLKVARGPLKSIQDPDNLLNGWFQLHQLIPLFQQPAFHAFPFNYASLANLVWAESAFECLNELIPALTQVGNDNVTFKKVEAELFTLVKESGKATTEMISTLSSESFLSAFFLYYQAKLDDIQKQASAILMQLEQFSRRSMQAYAQSLLMPEKKEKEKEKEAVDLFDLKRLVGIADSHLAKNRKKVDPAKLRKALLQTVNDNSHHMAAQCADSFAELTAKVAEYNHYLAHLKQTTALLFSILKLEGQNEQSIKYKIDELQPIHELYYQLKEIRKVMDDPSLAKDVSYFYLDMNMDNRFHSFSIAQEELAALIEGSKDYREHSIARLDILVNIAEIQLMKTKLSKLPVESFHQMPAFDLSKNIKLKEEDIDQLLQSMNKIMQIATGAHGISPVYVLGETSNGKSTLVNRLKGSLYKEKRVRGDLEPEWDDSSVPEVCKVGSNIGKSKTFVPQLVDIIYKDKIITYCDLPGFNGSRGRTASICEAYAPMLVNAQVDKVQGILWVLSDLQFKIGRAKQVKKDLFSLLQIAKGNPETLLNSLTIVITKGSKDLTKEDVLEKLQITVKTMKGLDEGERELLAKIIKKLEDPTKNSLIISQPYNHESSDLSDIHEAILSNEPLSPELFDFSLYSEEQKGFQHQVDKALQHKKLVLTTLESKQSDLENGKQQIEIKSKQEEKLGKEQEQKQAELAQLKNKIEELNKLSSTYQEQITNVEHCKKLVKIKKLKQEIAGQSHLVEVEVETGRYREIETNELKEHKVKTFAGYGKKTVGHPHGLFGPYHLSSHTAQNNYAKDLNDVAIQGYTASIVYPDGKLSHPAFWATKVVDDPAQPQYKTETKYKYKTKLVPVTRKEKISKPLPPGHMLEYTISFPASYPVKIKTKKSKGCTVKTRSEQTQAGYGAVICYEQGVGFTLNLEIYVAKKYTPEGRRFIAEKRSLKNPIDREIIQLDHQLGQLEERMAKLNENLVELAMQLLELHEQKKQFEEECHQLGEYLEKNQSCFDLLEKLSVMLNSKAPTLSANDKEKALSNNEQGLASLLIQHSSIFNKTETLSSYDMDDIPELLSDSEDAEPFNPYLK